MRALTFLFFFFNDTATTEIYTLSLHDALPILRVADELAHALHDMLGAEVSEETARLVARVRDTRVGRRVVAAPRSEEHTSELQSPCNLVCRLLLEKKKKKNASVSATSKHKIWL